MFLSSYRNTSESLGEREMLWEHEPQASVSTAFSSSPKLSTSLKLSPKLSRLGSALWVHNILTTVLTNIFVDKSTDNAEPLSICFLLQYSTPKQVFISERDQNLDTKKEQALSIIFSPYDWFISQNGLSWLAFT